MDLLNMINRAQILEFYKKVNRGNFYFSNQSFQIWCLFSGIEVRKTYKISVQYLEKYSC